MHPRTHALLTRDVAPARRFGKATHTILKPSVAAAVGSSALPKRADAFSPSAAEQRVLRSMRRFARPRSAPATSPRAAGEPVKDGFVVGGQYGYSLAHRLRQAERSASPPRSADGKGTAAGGTRMSLDMSLVDGKDGAGSAVEGWSASARSHKPDVTRAPMIVVSHSRSTPALRRGGRRSRHSRSSMHHRRHYPFHGRKEHGKREAISLKVSTTTPPRSKSRVPHETPAEAGRRSAKAAARGAAIAAEAAALKEAERQRRRAERRPQTSPLPSPLAMSSASFAAGKAVRPVLMGLSADVQPLMSPMKSSRSESPIDKLSSRPLPSSSTRDGKKQQQQQQRQKRKKKRKTRRKKLTKAEAAAEGLQMARSVRYEAHTFRPRDDRPAAVLRAAKREKRAGELRAKNGQSREQLRRPPFLSKTGAVGPRPARSDAGAAPLRFLRSAGKGTRASLQRSAAAVASSITAGLSFDGEEVLASRNAWPVKRTSARDLLAIARYCSPTGILATDMDKRAQLVAEMRELRETRPVSPLMPLSPADVGARPRTTAAGGGSGGAAVVKPSVLLMQPSPRPSTAF
eukprot:PLAT6625.1.p1 GENE.PLAT6625.1~~PLAT6625.1.p1  ORF type:complete len:573 (+),score=119.10 PLAT6625.1:68-1786(+)